MISAFRTVKGRLILFSLCISLIPIAVITMIYNLNATITMKHQILQEMTAIAESRRLHIMSIMQAKEERTKDFGSDGFIRDNLEAIVRGGYLKDDTVVSLNKHLLMNMKPLDTHIVAMAILGLNGKIITSTNDKIIGRNVAGWNEFMQSLRKRYSETYIGQPHHFPYLGVNSTFISSPIISRKGVVPLGVIITAYNLTALNEVTTNRAGLGETGEVYLVNRDRLMLTESRFIDDAPLNQVVDTEPVHRYINGEKEMSGIYTGYGDVSIVGASAYIPEYDWVLLAEVHKKEAFAPLKMLSIVALIVGLVGAAAVISVGIVFASSMSKPINRLKSVTDRFTAGDLAQRVEITSNDEIGALSHSFNAMAERISKEHSQLKKAQLAMVLKLSEVAEKRDPETGAHLRRIRSYCSILARELGRSEKYKNVINEGFIRQIGDFCPLHDIGKVGIPDSILLKPGRLTDEERDVMTKHALIGGEILHGIDYLKMGKDIAMHHHERWDGNGYPMGLSGDEIPLAARIVSVAEFFDALTTKRPYRDATSIKDAVRIIKEERGKALDPEIVDVFLKKLEDFVIIQTKHK
ncbi:MAG: HD domain-containing phosphohydrolase [Candidatus Brocadiales bacterium]